MAWDELDLIQGRWSIPRDRTKNGLPHDVPLAEPVITLLRGQPHRDGRSRVFGGAGGPFQGWSKAKAALDKRILASGTPGAAWRLHDLRRTVATRMAETGALPHVIEAVLNHVSGHKAGVAGVYNRATYEKEKREALNLWAQHMNVIIEKAQATRTVQ
jgi:integrase